MDIYLFIVLILLSNFIHFIAISIESQMIYWQNAWGNCMNRFIYNELHGISAVERVTRQTLQKVVLQFVRLMNVEKTNQIERYILK